MSKFTSEKCVLCLEVKPLTEEHIFPDGVGGCLTANILCKDCNSNLGSKVDAPYLDESYVQLARNALKISGKRNHIPQPFSEIYEVSTEEGKTRIRLDVDFKPKVVPKISDVNVGPDGSLAISLSVDADERAKLPGIIRKKIQRFFSTQAGKELGWTPEQIENAIVMASEQASGVAVSQSPVGTLQGNFKIDLKRIFLQHIKVAYEISCVQYKTGFIGSPRAEKIREFLFENSLSDKTATWDITTVAKQLRIAPQIEEPTILSCIRELTRNAPHAHHLALIVGQNVIISMLGLGVVLVDAVDKSFSSSAIFVNDIQNKKCSIQNF